MKQSQIKLKRKRMNKKGSIAAIITLVITLFVWVMMWMVIDIIDFSFDQVINDTWEDIDDNYTWYDQYGTFKDRKHNFKEMTFYTGTIVLLIGIGSMAYEHKVRKKS